MARNRDEFLLEVLTTVFYFSKASSAPSSCEHLGGPFHENNGLPMCPNGMGQRPGDCVTR